MVTGSEITRTFVLNDSQNNAITLTKYVTSIKLALKNSNYSGALFQATRERCGEKERPERSHKYWGLQDRDLRQLSSKAKLSLFSLSSLSECMDKEN